jgi:acyl carrier protein
MNDLYVELADILEVDEVAPDAVLADFPVWDSLTVLSVLAMLDAKYGVNLTADEMRTIRTATELDRVIAERKAK